MACDSAARYRNVEALLKQRRDRDKPRGFGIRCTAMEKGVWRSQTVDSPQSRSAAHSPVFVDSLLWGAAVVVFTGRVHAANGTKPRLMSHYRDRCAVAERALVARACARAHHRCEPLYTCPTVLFR